MRASREGLHAAVEVQCSLPIVLAEKGAASRIGAALRSNRWTSDDRAIGRSHQCRTANLRDHLSRIRGRSRLCLDMEGGTVSAGFGISWQGLRHGFK